MVHVSIKVASVPAGEKLRFPADIEYVRALSRRGRRRRLPGNRPRHAKGRCH